MSITKKKLGELLLAAGLIDENHLKVALAYQEEWGGRLGSILIKKGFVFEKDMMTILENQLGIESISLDAVERPSDEVLNMVRTDIAKKFVIFPLRFEGKSLLLATSDPTDLKTLDDIGFLLGFRIKPLLALESDILRAIDIHYEGGTGLRRTFRFNRQKLKEKVSRSMPYPEDLEISSEPSAPASPAVSKTVISQKAVIEGIIDLLIEKGVFTKDELLKKIRSKK